jgi:hypothetical protein
MILQNRIKNANEILNYAIEHNISAKKASVECGYSDTYVKNVKGLVNKLPLDEDVDVLFDLFYDVYDKYVNSKENKKTKQTKIEVDDYEMPKDLSKTLTNEQFKVDVKGDNTNIEWKGNNYSADHIKTLDELLDAAEVDLDMWKVKDFIINKWDVTAIIKDEAKTYQNFQVKARLERILENYKAKQTGEIFQEMIEDYEPPVYEPDFAKVLFNEIEENLLEINIADLHFGKLTHFEETGENYDTKIATKRFIDAINTLLGRANGFNFEKILFIVGNDFFNSDTILNTTTAGTPQDEDLRWYKTFRKGIHLLVDGINILKETGVPVDVIVIAGNHDYEKSFYMGEFLDAWFRNDNQVNIDNGASPRKYYRYGEVLLGFTHGSEEKEGLLPMIMATDVGSKKDWSETKYHEFQIGHWHHKKSINYKNNEMIEDNGVIVRCMSSLTATDAWHNKKGFVGSIKAADAFIFNKYDGLLAHLNANLKEE